MPKKEPQDEKVHCHAKGCNKVLPPTTACNYCRDHRCHGKIASGAYCRNKQKFGKYPAIILVLAGVYIVAYTNRKNRKNQNTFEHLYCSTKPQSIQSIQIAGFFDTVANFHYPSPNSSRTLLSCAQVSSTMVTLEEVGYDITHRNER